MKRKKLLFADHDTSYQSSSINKVLMESGFDVVTADNGRSAFEEVVRGHYDLVITELNLPRVNGLGLLRQIKEVKASLPVILVSENAGVKGKKIFLLI